MNRRSFAGALAGLAAARPLWPADSGRHTQFYTLDIFQLKQGTQAARMHDWLGKSVLPKISGPKIVLEAVIAPHTPQLAFIAGFSSFEEIWSALSKLDHPDPSGPEPPFETETLSILQAAPYSPEVAAQKHDKPRFFEMRQYHSPTASQLQALHERFAGPETRVFHRSGIHPLFYSSTVFGPNLPNLTYLIPFDSLAAREQAWDKFGADPEWIKARKESIDKSGQIVAVSDISIYRATPYSPVS